MGIGFVPYILLLRDTKGKLADDFFVIAAKYNKE